METKKLPPFGSILVERQMFHNPPWLVFVCVGVGAWEHAKMRNNRGDSAALVLPPNSNPSDFNWPVSGFNIVIDWNHGPDEKQVVELAKKLLESGAKSITIWPRFADFSNPHLNWGKSHPRIKTYHFDKSGVANAT